MPVSGSYRAQESQGALHEGVQVALTDGAIDHPDLSIAGVFDFFARIDSNEKNKAALRKQVVDEIRVSGRPEIVQLLLKMDVADFWTLDHQESTCDADTQQKIRQFIDKLSEFSETYGDRVAERCLDDFLSILGSITTSRCLYLLSFLKQKDERFMDAFFDAFLDIIKGDFTQDKTVGIRVVFQRILALYKANLFTSLYSEDRVKRILRVLRGQQRAHQ